MCVHLCMQELLVFTTTSSRDHWHGGASGDPNSLLRQVSGPRGAPGWAPIPSREGGSWSLGSRC